MSPHTGRSILHRYRISVAEKWIIQSGKTNSMICNVEAVDV